MKIISKKFLALVGISALLFSSCDKVELAKDLGDRGQTIVKLLTSPNDNGSNYNLATINLVTTPQSLAVIDVRRDVPNEGELNKTLTVMVKDDPAAIAAFNVLNGTALVPLPAANYTVDAANPLTGGQYSITFQPGEFSKMLKINIPNSASWDLSKRYAVGLTLMVPTTGADGRVSLQNRTAVVEIGLKNKWDGIYELAGYTLRDGDPDKTGNFNPVEMALITIAPNSVEFGDLQVWADNTGVGIGTPVLTINESTVPNPVTVTSSGGAVNVSASANYYDPATKTFHLDYTWGGGITSRRATVTLKYLRAR